MRTHAEQTIWILDSRHYLKYYAVGDSVPYGFRSPFLLFVEFKGWIA